MNNVTITFDESAKADILGFFGKKINDNSLIVEKKDSEPVYSFDGEEVTLEEFGGIQKGSEVFIKKDVASLMKYTER